MRWVFAFAAVIATPSYAQVVSTDTSGLQAQINAAKVKADAAAASATAACQPMALVPPAEVVGGSAGTGTTCRLANAVQPRITRAGTFTTTAGGVISGTWAIPLDQPPNIVFTPILSGSSMVTCKLTAAPTASSFTGMCKTEQQTILSLSIVTSGLTVAPATTTAAGVQVQVTALPPTQAAQ